ncbi:hypothetical protein [Aliivibrio salmonicida]|uniref:hypothetical protein n=1 Tax=Aliivibrio salmonicida TaxID=40269 RepID=UPI003D0CF16B
MNKNILTLILFGSLLSGSSLAEKVTYDKAVANSNAYQNSLPYYENATTGLSSAESGSTGLKNQMGKWVRLSLIPFDNAGAYSKILTPSSIGSPCVKGAKGIIPTKKNGTSRCEDNSCNYWQDVTQSTYNYSHGYTAECR